MQRISNDIIDRMIQAKLTKCEMNLMLFLSFYQDEYGRVYGVHYKEACDATGMSYQEFYNAKKSLVEKQFIYAEKSNRIDHDITIRNNAFLTREDDKRGYINTGHNIFHTKEFYQLKAGSMLLALKLMKNTYDKRGYFKIGVKNFYEKYTQIFGVTKRMLRYYLMQLKCFFSIGIKDGNYYIEPKKVIYKAPGGKSEAECLREQRAQAVLRRNRIKNVTSEQNEDIRTFFRQYEPTARDRGKKLFFLIDAAIASSIAGKKKRSLNMLLIHKLIRKNLFTDQEDAHIKCSENNQNQFLNINQRNYDYDELERLLLNSQPQNI